MTRIYSHLHNLMAIKVESRTLEIEGLGQVVGDVELPVSGMLQSVVNVQLPVLFVSHHLQPRIVNEFRHCSQSVSNG